MDNKRYIEAAQNAETSIRLAELLHLADARIKKLEGALDMAGEMASERAVWIDKMLTAGDQMAHDLLYRQHQRVLDQWWKLREGSCTVCDPALHSTIDAEVKQ